MEKDFIEINVGKGTLVSSDNLEMYVMYNDTTYCAQIRSKGFLIYQHFDKRLCLYNQTAKKSPNISNTVELKQGRGILIAKYSATRNNSTFFLYEEELENTLGVIEKLINYELLTPMFDYKLKNVIIPKLKNLKVLV